MGRENARLRKPSQPTQHSPGEWLTCQLSSSGRISYGHFSQRVHSIQTFQSQREVPQYHPANQSLEKENKSFWPMKGPIRGLV